MIAYKLLRQRHNGSFGPLFINRKQIIEINKWLKAECYPTKGFAIRKGWHTTSKPIAPHLHKRKRIWAKVEIKNFKKLYRPISQGGLWFIAQKMKIIKILNI